METRHYKTSARRLEKLNLSNIDRFFLIILNFLSTKRTLLYGGEMFWNGYSVVYYYSYFKCDYIFSAYLM